MAYARAVTAGVLLALLVIVAVRADIVIGQDSDISGSTVGFVIIVSIIVLLLDVDVSGVANRLRGKNGKKKED